jgi:hypothetical protein
MMMHLRPKKIEIGYRADFLSMWLNIGFSAVRALSAFLQTLIQDRQRVILPLNMPPSPIHYPLREIIIHK